MLRWWGLIPVVAIHLYVFVHGIGIFLKETIIVFVMCLWWAAVRNPKRMGCVEC